MTDREVVTLHEFISTEALLYSDFYRLTMKPSGLYDFLGADLRVPGDIEARFRLARYEGKPPFGQHDRVPLGLITSHLPRTIRAHARPIQLSSAQAPHTGSVQQPP